VNALLQIGSQTQKGDFLEKYKSAITRFCQMMA